MFRQCIGGNSSKSIKKIYNLCTLSSLEVIGEEVSMVKAKFLLAYVALEQREKTPLKNDVFNLIWPDSKNPSASGSTACSIIRKSLSGVLDNQINGSITVHNVSLDIFRLEEAVANIQQKIALKKNLEIILDSYRGPFLNNGKNLEKSLRNNNTLINWIKTYSSKYENLYWEAVMTYVIETGDLEVPELAFKTINDFPVTEEYLNLFYATFVYRRSYLRNIVYANICEVFDDYEQMNYLQAKQLLQSSIHCEVKEETDLVMATSRSVIRTNKQHNIQSNLGLSNLTIVIPIVIVLVLLWYGGLTVAILVGEMGTVKSVESNRTITFIGFVVSNIVLLFSLICVIVDKKS